jgi:Dolichyl-phosphate-mannose-protein mannosyltransferase
MNYNQKVSSLFSVRLPIIIPLALSVITHLLNPIGFPSVHTDEGHYMNRALHLLQGIGPHEGENIYTRIFDHPYFGQVLVAAALGLVNYPDFVTDGSDGESQIRMLYIVPRTFMGLLAVADTFLVYKVAERRYNKTVALIASTMFAVMPFSWLLRRILLDNLLLPFLLCSVFFALSVKRTEKRITASDKDIIMIFLSGIFLGLAIFTKIPSFAFIPLLSFILISRTRNLKLFLLWLIPVLAIPSIWPAYAVYSGDFEEWKNDILWQATERVQKPLATSLQEFSKIEPVLFSLSIVGIVFAGFKRDFFILFWSLPYLLFLYLIGFTNIINLIGIQPVFCMAVSLFLLSGLTRMKKKYRSILLFALITSIVTFGLTSNIVIASLNMTSSYFKTVAVIAGLIEEETKAPDVSNSNGITLAGYRWVPGFSWILDQVLQKDVEYQKFYFKADLETDKFILIADRSFYNFLYEKDAETENLNFAEDLFNKSQVVAHIKDNTTRVDQSVFPYNALHDNRGIGDLEIRTNFSRSSTIKGS